MDPEPTPHTHVRSRWPRFAIGGLLLLAGLGVVLAIVWARPHIARPRAEPVAPLVVDEAVYQPPATTGFVGSQKCAECHGQIAMTFKAHPMAQSASLINQDVAGGQPAAHGRVVGKQRVLDVEFQDDVMRHHERMYDASGELIYDHAVPLKFAIGSGRRARAYVLQRGDALFMSPLNWYSQAAKWDLAPNYEPDDPKRFDRRVTDECLSCHTGKMASIGRSLNRFEPKLFHEMSIGCENCHGPGEQHVAFRESTATGVDPIVNPAKLDVSKRESVCNQCHLQTAVRVARLGRSHFDFRPGHDFEDVWVALDTDLGVAQDGRTRSVNHVQQMRESRCYVESAGKLGCISCHDPHSVPAEDERVGFYRQRCFQCHQDESCSLSLNQRLPKENSCIACHMPARDSKNISHVTQTDHRVIRKEEESSAEPQSSTTEALAIRSTSGLTLPDWERDRALAVGAWIYLTKADRKPPQDLARTLLRVLDKTRRDPAVTLTLGALAMQYGLEERARDTYESGRKLPEAEEESLWGLLNIYYPGANWEQGLECADRLLEIDPGYAKVHALRADILRKLDRHGEAIQAAERAIEFNPTLVPVREWLVEAYRATGREAKQREQEDILRRMRDARPPR